MKVLLDTNFLLVPGQFNVDIFSEIARLVPGAEFVALSQVVIEIDRLLSGDSKDARAARLGKQLLKRVKIIDSEGSVDKAILEYAGKHECVVCTNDRELRSSLKKAGAATIFLRSKNHLERE